MSVSNAFLRVGVLALIAGVAMGIWMGASEDFTLRPVHAHINLIGWASMMIFGLFYHVFPKVGGRLPWIHFVLAVVGFVMMMPGLALVLTGRLDFLPLLIAGEFTVATSILIFTFILFRATGSRPSQADIQ